MDTVLEQLREALKDRYRLESELGRGGMATVFKAIDLRYERPVAIKVLSPDLSSALSAERFEREILISAKLSHPNILTVLDSGKVGDLLYYVMTFVDGESLRARLKRETYLPIGDAIKITTEVCDALSYAHSEGVIHRDIKPENILLRGGHVLVADFGIARATTSGTDEQPLTQVGMSVGTAQYMSPEQATGDTVDPRTDIYSLGCTLYEMLAGQPPYTGPNPMAIAARRMIEPVPSIRVVRPAVPEELEAIALHSLERVAADRFQTMEEFKQALLGEAPFGTMSFTTSRSVPLYMTATRQIPVAENKSRRMMMIGGGIAAALLVIAGTFFFYRSRQSTGPISPDANKVAVLYFDDASKGSLTYVADGLTESLIDRLSSVSALDVISKEGVRVFRGRDVSADSVARALKVGSIVRGTVDREGNKVAVDVKLVDASGVGIDSKHFSIDTANIMAARDTLAQNVADFLRERVGTQLSLRQERDEAKNPQAWILVERAQKQRKDADSLAEAGSKDAALVALARADSMLASAQSVDAQWAKIPVLRASVKYAEAAIYADQPPKLASAIDSGLAHADQALKIQPNDPDAYEIKGELQYRRYQRRVDSDARALDELLTSAETNLQKSVELNKDQAGAHATLSSLYYFKPDIQQANTEARAAYEADAYLSSARAILKRLFWTSHDLEQFPEALKWCDEGRRRFPTDPDFTACRLWMYTTRPQRPDIVDSAWIYRQRYVDLNPEAKKTFAKKLGDILVGGALARANLVDSAKRVLVRARATPQEDPERELEGYEAVMRVILGDQDEAVRLIADYLTVNPGHRKGFATRTGWWWRDIQGNPKFKALIAGAR